MTSSQNIAFAQENHSGVNGLIIYENTPVHQSCTAVGFHFSSWII